MYIWVILATFLAMLYSYNLSHRADVRELEIEPVAKALISKLVVKQQSAGRYMRGNTPPYAGSVGADGTYYPSSNITYTAGILTTDDIEGYLPYGYKDDGSVTTEIYCLNKNNLSQSMNCDSEDAIRYLVAYTVIPQRWLNVKTGIPNNDFNNAMKQLIGYDSSFGYLTCREYEIDPETEMKTCKDYAIRGREGLTGGIADASGNLDEDASNMPVPEYIVNNGGFGSTCGNNKTGNALCLMYVYEYKSRYYN